jgi:hypothetical protein
MKRILYSVALPFALLWQVIISLFHRDSQRHGFAEIIFYIKKEYHENSLILLGYSLFPLLFISIVYFVCEHKDILPCWMWKGEIFYPFILGIGALIITIIIAININPKRIENGDEFIKCLIEHIYFLNSTKTESKKMYIITPNINIGAGKGNDENFSRIIRKHKYIEFHFICLPIEKGILKSYVFDAEIEEKIKFFKETSDKNKMLKFIYKRYKKEGLGKKVTLDEIKLDAMAKELYSILDCENVKIHNCLVDLESEKISGYLSDFECVFGRYSDVNEQKGEIGFKGELITTEEFINIIKEQMLNHFIKLNSGDQFMYYLYKHIDDLNHDIPLREGEKHDLYIITPNITIGYGPKHNFLTAIKNNKNIQFKFICKTIDVNSLNHYEKLTVKEDKEGFLKKVNKTTDSMLDYMYERYHDGRWERLEDSIEVLKQILKITEERDNNVQVIQKYDEIYRNKNVGGYISDKECVLGTYENIEGKKGEICFSGDKITSPELIYIVKADMIEKIRI